MTYKVYIKYKFFANILLIKLFFLLKIISMAKTKSKKSQILICIISGVFVGFINGFFGGGGGMIVVPLLIFLLHLEEKVAHATAILIILPLSITSSIIYITTGGFEILNLGLTTIGVVLGGIIGAVLLKKINNTALRFVFSFIMIVAGIKMMF
ncbi:MAG: TSUP family transporter [Christensenellales bacterium]